MSRAISTTYIALNFSFNLNFKFRTARGENIITKYIRYSNEHSIGKAGGRRWRRNEGTKTIFKILNQNSGGEGTRRKLIMIVSSIFYHE